jgi:hypothetical protein
MSTFEELLDGVPDLPLDRQELLIEIMQRRMKEERRKVLAAECHEALEEFRSSNLKPISANEAILETRSFLG